MKDFILGLGTGVMALALIIYSQSIAETRVEFPDLSHSVVYKYESKSLQPKNNAKLYYKQPMALNDATINFLNSKEADGLIIEPDPSVEWKLSGAESGLQVLAPIFNRGKASWYDYSLKDFPNYSKNNFTAASRDYPRGTKLKVCREYKSIREITCCGVWTDCVEVRVNDYVENPDVIIDLSSKAFSQLAGLGLGIIDVSIKEIK